MELKTNKRKTGTLTKMLEGSGQELTINSLVDKIIQYKNSSYGRLYQTINQHYLLSLMDKQKIQEIEKNFPESGADIIDFVKLMLQQILHKQDETLYIVMALIDLFKQISESHNMSQTIQFRDLTSILCDQMQEKDTAQYKIQTLKMPEPQKFKIDPTRIRSIDIDPPPIYGRYDEDLQRLAKQKIKTDSMHHLNHKVKQGYYAKDMKRVLSLDSLADRINMYNLDCELKHIIKPKGSKVDETEKMIGDVLIFSFAWSERQQRIGATLKDFTLCFWDRGDNFKYEKQIAIQNFCSDYQANIWYLEFPNCWVTTDSKNQIYEWDLEKECIKRTLSSSKIKHTIFDITEISQLKLVAVGSSDRLVTIWDFTKGILVQQIEFQKAGVHSLLYFSTYSALICGGFQNSISIHSISPEHLDVNLLGNLVGHQSMISAIDCVEKTPMIISSDDSGAIKIWDIRTLKCIQTLDCGYRTIVTKLLNVYEEGKLCFLGARLNVIEFEESDILAKKSHAIDDNFPIKVENSQNCLIAVTRKDIRFIDINSGRVKQTFVGLMNDGEDEITQFKQIEQGSKFILANHRGEITLHNMRNGEIISKLNSHSNEVTNLNLDFLNKLLISAGYDSNIKIQRLGEFTNEIKREITNCCYNKVINLIEVSVHHNLLFASSGTKSIFVFDYEFARLISEIQVDKNVEVQAISVVNGFSLLIIATNNGLISILSFNKKENFFTTKLLGSIDIAHLADFHVGINCQKCTLMPQDIPQKEVTPNDSNSKTTEQKSGKTQQLSQKNSGLSGQASKSLNEEKQEKNVNQKQLFANKILVDCQITEKEGQTKISKLDLFCSLNKGDIFGINLLNFCNEFENIVFLEHCNQKGNYNAFRANTEDFLKSIEQIKSEKIVIDGNTKLCKEGRKCSDENLHFSLYSSLIFYNNNAHRDTVTAISLVTFTVPYLMTSSMDCYIKLWDKSNGFLSASMNINHPLPIMWTIKSDEIKDGKKKIIFALKLLDILNKKYNKVISIQESSSLKIIDFINLVSGWKETDEDEYELFKEESKNKEVLVMKDEYSPRDLKFEQSKQFYQSELRGPSLKRMEANKRVSQATKMWRQQVANKEAAIESRVKEETMTKGHKAEEREELITFLNQGYRNKVIRNEFSKISEEFTKPTLNLLKKMDAQMFKKRKATQQQIGQNNPPSQSKIPNKAEGHKKKLSIDKRKKEIQPRVRESTDNIYNYANKMNYIDTQGYSLYHSKISYPSQKPTNQDTNDSRFQVNYNSSFNQQNNSHLFEGSSMLNEVLVGMNPIGNQTMNSSISNHFKNITIQQNDSMLSNQIANNDKSKLSLKLITNPSYLNLGNNQNNLTNTSLAPFPSIEYQNTTSQNHNNSTTFPNNSTFNQNTSRALEESNQKSSRAKKVDSLPLIKNTSEKEQGSQLRVSKLQQLLKSMELKVKKSKQAFADDLLVSSFLEKRQELKPSFNKADVIFLGNSFGQTDRYEEQKEEPLNLNESGREINTIRKLQKQIQSNKSNKQLTPAGLETLKIALYDQRKSNCKIIPEIKESTNKKSLKSDFLPLIQVKYASQMVDSKTQVSETKNTHLSTDADEILNTMQNSLFDNPFEAQSNFNNHKNNKHHNISNALNIKENAAEQDHLTLEEQSILEPNQSSQSNNE